MNNGLRLGVFLCDCGNTMSNPIDFLAIKAKLERLDDVKYVAINHDLCLKKAQGAMQKEIRDRGINGVVVAACSPELHEDTFMNVLQRAGVNPHLVSMANIREQCFWTHPHKEKAAQKAMAQIEIAINRARLLEPVERAEITVNQDVLIVGGGVVGTEAAIELSNLNLKTTLIEKEAALGGKLNQFTSLYPLQITPEEVLASKLKQVAESENIDVLTSAELIDVRGQAGDFVARIKRGDEEFVRNFGAIILATGYDAQSTSQPYGFEMSNNIVTQSQLERMLKSPGETKEVPRNVGLIIDVCDEHSRISTLAVLRNALGLKEKFGSEVCVLCKNLKVDGAGLEKLYRDCRDRGVVFLKFDKPPKISRENGEIHIQVEDVLMPGEQMALSCDLLVVEEMVIPPRDSETLRSILDIGLDPQGFYQDNNIHLYPTLSNREGIFFAGNCHADLDLIRALTEAGNATLNAYRLLAQGKVTVEAERVAIDPSKCRFCLTCIRACPHDAIREVQTNHEKRVAQIVDLACQGCGICAAVCPAKAIRFKGWSDDQILAELEPVGAYL